MIKKEKTPEEIEAAKKNAKENRAYAGLVRRVISQCKEQGVRNMELQFNYLKQHPKTILPVDFISHERNVEAYETGIKRFKNGDY